MTKPRDPPTSVTRERGDLPEASYRLLFDAVADPILVATEEGRYIDANDPAVALTGYTREQLRELRLNEILVVDPDWGRAELESLRATGSWRGELDLLRKDGRLVPVEANATRLMLS